MECWWKTLKPRSVLLLCPRNALIDRLTAGKSIIQSVPVRDSLLAQFPAKKNDFAFNFTGKIQQTDIEVLNLHSGGIDFGDGVLDLLNGLFALAFASRHVHHVHQQA